MAWPPATKEDAADVVYLAQLDASGAVVVAASAAGARSLGVAADAASEVVLSPDGRYLYYGLASALHQYEMKTARDRAVASFPAGEARELPAEGKDEGKVLVWRCGYRFRDVVFGPGGRLGFLLEPTTCPQPDERWADFNDAARKSWRTREAFAAEVGAYILDAGEAPVYLGPARALYGFAGDDLVLENKLTPARYDFKTGGVTALLGKGAHEVGWVPAAAVAADKIAVVGAKAREKSFTDIVNRVYIITARGGSRRPFLEITARAPASRAALSPDGRYLAVELVPARVGAPQIYAVDLARKSYRPLVAGGRLVRFAQGSAAVFYVSAEGRAGDLYLAGLDGRARRLTTSGKVLPPP